MGTAEDAPDLFQSANARHAPECLVKCNDFAGSGLDGCPLRTIVDRRAIRPLATLPHALLRARACDSTTTPRVCSRLSIVLRTLCRSHLPRRTQDSSARTRSGTNTPPRGTRRCKGGAGFSGFGSDRRSGRRGPTRWYPRQSLPLPPGLRRVHLGKSHSGGHRGPRLATCVCHPPEVFEVIENGLDSDGAFHGNSEANTAAFLHSKELPAIPWAMLPRAWK